MKENARTTLQVSDTVLGNRLGTQTESSLINCFSSHNASKILASRVSITVYNAD